MMLEGRGAEGGELVGILITGVGVGRGSGTGRGV